MVQPCYNHGENLMRQSQDILVNENKEGKKKNVSHSFVFSCLLHGFGQLKYTEYKEGGWMLKLVCICSQVIWLLLK